jgi:hypothetical protein
MNDETSFVSWAEAQDDSVLLHYRSLLMGILSRRADQRLLGVATSSVAASNGSPSPATLPSGQAKTAKPRIPYKRPPANPQGSTDGKDASSTGYITVGKKTFRKRRPQPKALVIRQANNWLDSSKERIKAAKMSLNKSPTSEECRKVYAKACYDHQLSLEYRRLLSRIQAAGLKAPLVDAFRASVQKAGVSDVTTWGTKQEPPVLFENLTLEEWDKAVKSLSIASTNAICNEIDRLLGLETKETTSKRSAGEGEPMGEEPTGSTSKQVCAGAPPQVVKAWGPSNSPTASSGLATQILLFGNNTTQ